jgi:hypothetical protein
VAHMGRMNRSWSSVFVPVLAVMFLTQTVVGQDQMPMVFMDIINMPSVGGSTVSPGGNLMLDTRSITDWKSAKDFTEIYLVSMSDGIDSTRQMMYTKEKHVG